jgi:hypothetical protein
VCVSPLFFERADTKLTRERVDADADTHLVELAAEDGVVVDLRLVLLGERRQVGLELGQLLLHVLQLHRLQLAALFFVFFLRARVVVSPVVPVPFVLPVVVVVAAAAAAAVPWPCADEPAPTRPAAAASSLEEWVTAHRLAKGSGGEKYFFRSRAPGPPLPLYTPRPAPHKHTPISSKQQYK